MIITNEHTSCDWIDSWPIICRITVTDCGSGMVSWEQQDTAGLETTLPGYQTCIWNIHIISCDLCHCKHLVTHVDLMISIEILHPYVCLTPYPNPAHSKEQWCHGFINSLSPKHKEIHRLTLSQVNPRPQRGRHNFSINDDMILIYWIDQNLHMWNVFH